ncbi:hypothetical protein LTR10_007585 [Elasticomyces elasticus]|nr:hypothetical protein LTR10_007585 [Elasticomyces elasticus]KAK4970589.1 hypothetical protein LTR42_007564 [Elasticomyces elasticus]
MAATVLGTVELLEAILLDLGAQDRKRLKTLLLSQRVCKTFQATIQDSPKLQEMLFFRAVKRSQGSETQTPAIRFNELLLHRDENEASFSFWDFGAGRYVYDMWSAHEYGVKAHICKKTDPRCAHAQWEETVVLSMVITLHLMFSELDSTDSWQRMLLVQTEEVIPVRLEVRNKSWVADGVKFERLDVGETVRELLTRVWPKYRGPNYRKIEARRRGMSDRE